MKTDIAIIGMAGRFPGAADVDAFWRNLCCGKEAVRLLTDDELASAGLHPRFLSPNFVKAAAFLDGAEWFDASFFGISPREAEIMDPQQRLFLECAWEAIENAGYAGESCSRTISVYAGATMNTYLPCNLLQNPEAMESVDVQQLNLANSPDFLATRVSYKLNLTGSSQTVQSACSTSLVAVHHACQGILRGECEMALAGGVSINLQLRHGYKYLAGGMASPDGHCRPFDQNAQGTIFASGLGVVVLKAADVALKDRDCIHAIIKGSAINNDGSLKVGYTAPSINGQAKVIIEALANAGVDPATIGYVEAHGTATPLGDPIEIQALAQAFGAVRARKNSCAIGSVKGNLGHLDAAAGVTGLIKTVLCLKHRSIPPTLHFTRPNPEIGIEETPFYVNTQLREWKSNGQPRRAGVSSFGVGGTNAHVVLEEAPQEEKQRNGKRDWELLLWSARSETALEQMTSNLGGYLKQHEEANLGDVAYTLQMGRRSFPFRRFAVCRTREEAATAMAAMNGDRLCTRHQERQQRPVVFLFPGQGSEYAGMGKKLYEEGTIYQKEVDRCSLWLKEKMGVDIREVLYGHSEQKEQLHQTWLTQPMLFVVEYALARQWISWGMNPAGMLGHSLGEYAAGCVSGVFSLEEGLNLVVVRGRLMQKMPPGKMLVAGLGESEAETLRRPGVWVAAVNGLMQCVLSGEAEAVEELEQELLEAGVSCKRLAASHAFHSGMTEPILEEFREEVRRVKLQAPQVPFISNATGEWITAEEATDPEYWVRHLRATVRIGDGMKELARNPHRIFLEVGPGNTMSKLAKQQTGAGSECLPGLSSEGPDTEGLLSRLGQLWLCGALIDWNAFNCEQAGYRLPLPTYPYERQRYWIEPKTRLFGTGVPNAGLLSSLESGSIAHEHAQGPESKPPQPEPLHLRPQFSTPYASPTNKLEATIAVICQKILSISAIGIDDNFFELGGDSLMALQVIAEMKEVLAVEIPVARFYECFTIRSLAAMLEHDRSEAAPSEDRGSKIARRRDYQQMEHQKAPAWKQAQ